MSDTKPQAEPTMEEILASIRKIISEDSPAGAVAGDPPAAPAAAPPPPAPPPKPAAAPAPSVLDLTNEVKDDGSIVPVTAAPPPPPPPTPPPQAPVYTEQHVELDDGGLVSAPVANVAAQSFANLVSSVGASRGLPLGNTAQTLEELTKDLLRPMLKQWLDANLATIVQRVVEREVAKLALRADNDHLR